MVLDHIHEVRRFTRRARRADNLQRRVLGRLKFFLRDVFVFQHLGQHAVARLRSALRMTVRGRIVVRRANDSRKVSALRDRELPQVLAKIGNAGFGEAANSKTPAVPEVYFVGVKLENLLLIETLLELDRNHRF